MDNKVFTVLYNLVHIAVGLETTVCGVEGETVGDLLIKGLSGICSEEQESDSRLPIFTVHNILVGIALSWDTGCQKSVYIDMLTALYGKLPVVLKAVVPGQLGELLGYSGHNKEVILGIFIDRLQASSSPPYLKEGIRTGGGHLIALVLHPRDGR